MIKGSRRRWMGWEDARLTDRSVLTLRIPGPRDIKSDGNARKQSAKRRIAESNEEPNAPPVIG
jgi:hypothetical protein